MIRIEKFREAHLDQWEEFVFEKARNATWLHSRRFFDYHPENKIEDHSLLFFEGQNLIAALPATLKNEALISHPRATYGGLAIDRTVGAALALDLVRALTTYAKENGISAIRIKPSFRIFHDMPSDETDYAFWQTGFRIVSRDLEHVVDLRHYDENTLSIMTPKARNQVRKAEREVLSASPSQDLRGFWKVLEANLREKQKPKPTHSLEEIHRLMELVGHDRIQLMTVHSKEEILAGALLFLANAQAVHVQYLAASEAGRSLCAMNRLLKDLFSWAKQRGAVYVNLGRSTENDGKNLNEGLAHFKEGMGARGIIREVLEWTPSSN